MNLNIPLRNRVAQADQARSQMEYRQTQMRLQQLYTQIRIQVINGLYALTNDRANVQAAQTARDFNAQSLEAEQKKYALGASTTANVLQQERNLATGENNLISATCRLRQGPLGVAADPLQHPGTLRHFAGGCRDRHSDDSTRDPEPYQAAATGPAQALDGALRPPLPAAARNRRAEASPKPVGSGPLCLPPFRHAPAGALAGVGGGGVRAGAG